MVRRDLELVGSDFGLGVNFGLGGGGCFGGGGYFGGGLGSGLGGLGGLGGEGSLEFLARRGFDLVQGGFLEDWGDEEVVLVHLVDGSAGVCRVRADDKARATGRDGDGA